MRKEFSTIILGVIILALSLVAVGCSNPDGPMLSDEEKIKKTHDGRAEYEKAMAGRAQNPAGGAPTTSGSPSGQ